jgi:hypothetical protein
MMTVWGCEALSNFGSTPRPTPASAPSSAPTATPTPEPTASPMAEEAPHEKHRGRGRATAESSASPEATPTGAAPTITLDNDEAARRRAQGLLDSAHAKLGKVDRSKLSGDDAATYAQATGFADAATHALGEHDYVAATGLAEKASLLADKVEAATAATPSQTGF